MTNEKNALHILENSVSYIYLKENSDDNIERLVIGHKYLLRGNYR